MATREHVYAPPDTQEQRVNNALARAYTLNWEAIAYAVILVLAVITRFVDLGARVMSHDESLHTYYSWRLYEFGEFNHTPLMHGPVIFHMNALFYFLFGDTDFTARIYTAVLGVLIVMFPLLFRRWLGRVGAVLAAIMLLISPQILYYSRYIREDIPTIFFTLVFIYGLFQYVDGAPPRRPVWLWVVAAGMLLMLASKELAFIYLLIFVVYLFFFLVLRYVQDVGVQRRPPDAEGWRPPWLQTAFGHAVLLALAALAAYLIGSLARQFLLPSVRIDSEWTIVLPLFAVLYLPLAASGLVRRALTGGRSSEGAASAIMSGLAQTRSAFMVLIAGAIIGTILALLVISVLDIIKPETVWQTTTVASAGAEGGSTTEVTVDTTMLVRLVTWIGLPVLITVFILFLSAVFSFPGTMPLPWREVLLILMVAFLVCGVLIVVERHSHVSDEETAEEPFAADITASGESIDGGQYNNNYIWATWAIALVAVLIVLATRFLTDWWDFFNRQPVFDVLVVVVTLILPWATAFPLYLAGYNLEEYNPNTGDGRDTLNAAVAAFIPFAFVALTVGLAWNWRRWLPAAAVFLGLFAFFFTTVFSNQYGLATGMVGSLGYWLAQQSVRRGSQPQYYYLLTQIPVYEFLPLIGASLAGIAGLGRFWRWRRRGIEAERARHFAELDAASTETETPRPASTVVAAPDDGADAEGALEDVEGAPPLTGQPSIVRYTDVAPRYYRPFDPDEERARRASVREWLGEIPFMPFVGFWAVFITLGLTVAGEKMPWLTTHIVVPLVFAAAWWLGRVITGLRRDVLRDGGWLAILVALPVFFVALARVILPLWGTGTPFAGRTAEALATTGTWLAALLIAGGALAVLLRFRGRFGSMELGRMALITGALLLGVLTVRASVRAAYIDYDYATEYLVYAHGGPAVKTVMNEVDAIAERTNQGHNLRVVYDDQSSWPFTWYFRHYTNYGYLSGEAGSVDPSTLSDAAVIVVGGKKAGDVRRIVGDRYYEFSYIRLWWPMQEYFNLTYQRVANLFSLDEDNIAARYYRQGLWDIWLDRDYSTYGQAMCIADRQARCEGEAAAGETEEERDRLRNICQRAVVSECASDSRFDVNNWPVSDRMYFFVDKQIAAQIWDAGIGGASVDVRAPEYPEDQVFREIPAERIIARGAGLTNPHGVAVADDGTIYVADTDNNRIAVLNPNGDLIGTLGTDPASEGGPGTLRQPWGVALGPDGNVYVADTWNHRVLVFSPEGDLLRAWGHEGVPPADTTEDAFWGPRDVAIGPDGNVYVADTGNKRVRVYTLEGEFLRDIGSGGSGPGQLDEPVGLAFNMQANQLYVAEAWNQRVQAFTLDGAPIRSWDVNMWFNNRESYNRPFIAFSEDRALVYVTDMDEHQRIVAYDLNGQPVMSFNQPDALEADVLGLRSPAGLAVDQYDRLHVVDAAQGLVYIFPPLDVAGGESSVPLDEGLSVEATEDVGIIVEPSNESGSPLSTAPVDDLAPPDATETPGDAVTAEAVG